MTGPPPEELLSRLPLPGPLREEGGVIWWAAQGCADLQVDRGSGSIALGSGEVALLPEQRCEVWPAPDGSAALTRIETGLELFADRIDGDPAVIGHEPGDLVGSPVWRSDGSAFAYCLQTGDGRRVQVVTREGAGAGRIPGACSPAWLTDGRLAVARAKPRAITVAGETLLGPKQIEKLLPKAPANSDPAVVSLSASGGRLLAGLLYGRGEEALGAALVVLSESGSVEATAELPAGRVPVAAGLSPDAKALWYGDGELDEAILLVIPGGSRLLPAFARWLAWSPSGRFLAAATDRGIVVSTWPGREEVAVIPANAHDIAWTGG